MATKSFAKIKKAMTVKRTIHRIRSPKPSPTVWVVHFRNAKSGVILDIDLTVRDPKSYKYTRYATSYIINRSQLLAWTIPPRDLSAYQGNWKFMLGKQPKLKNRVATS